MIGEGDAFLFEGFADLIEVRRSTFHIGLCEVRFLVWNPRTNGKLQPQRLRLLHRRGQVLRQWVILKVPTDRSQATLLEQRSQFFRAQAVRVRRFHLGESHRFDLVERARHVGLERIAQTVKLQSERAFEIAVEFNRMRAGSQDEEGKKKSFHGLGVARSRCVSVQNEPVLDANGSHV
jgi:hypothetical protein